MDIQEQLTAIFREVLEDDALELTPELEASRVKHWDSLNHINLIVAIERAFDCELTTEEFGRATHVGALLELLKTKVSQRRNDDSLTGGPRPGR